MISTTYDPEADALYVRIAPKGTAVAETKETEPGIMFDLDANGAVIGIEVLDVRARSAGPATRAAAA
jgi:uncharacterized protein YuzE